MKSLSLRELTAHPPLLHGDIFFFKKKAETRCVYIRLTTLNTFSGCVAECILAGSE